MQTGSGAPGNRTPLKNMKDNKTIIAISIIVGSIIIATTLGMKKSAEEICYDIMYNRLVEWNKENNLSFKRDPVIDSIKHCFTK